MIVDQGWPKRRVEANILIDDRVAKEYVDNHGVFWVRLFACDVCLRSSQSPRANLHSLPHGIAQGVALVLDCGWIKGLGLLFLQLIPLVLPKNT